MFKSFNDVSRKILGVNRKFQGCYKEVSRVFQESFKSVSRKSQRKFTGVSRKFQGYSSNIEGHIISFKGVQEYLKEVQQVC